MRRFPLLAALFVLGRPAGAAAQPRLVDNMETLATYAPVQAEPRATWQGQAFPETADYKEGAGCRRFEVRSGGSD